MAKRCVETVGFAAFSISPSRFAGRWPWWFCSKGISFAMVPYIDKLKDDRNLWANCCIVHDYFHYRSGQLPHYLTAAYDALDYWHAMPTSEMDSASDMAMEGAFSVIAKSIEIDTSVAYSTCRSIAKYFSSRNMNCAFRAIVRFQYPMLSRYTIYVADKLIEVATTDHSTSSLKEMTVRGIAFRSLFELDHQYKHWKELAVARDECVHGLLAWGSFGTDNFLKRNREIASQIMRYVHPVTGTYDA